MMLWMKSNLLQDAVFLIRVLVVYFNPILKQILIPNFFFYECCSQTKKIQKLNHNMEDLPSVWKWLFLETGMSKVWHVMACGQFYSDLQVFSYCEGCQP